MDYLIISSLSCLCYPFKRRTLETAFSSQIYLDLPILPPDSPCQTIWITGMAQLEASCLNQRFVPWRTVEMLWGGALKALPPQATSRIAVFMVWGCRTPSPVPSLFSTPQNSLWLWIQILISVCLSYSVFPVLLTQKSDTPSLCGYFRHFSMRI